jgi:hypothetical protein
MFFKTAALIGASAIIVGALGSIPLARKSRDGRKRILWISFIVVALTLGAAVIADETGLLGRASYSTISLILMLAYFGLRVAMTWNVRATNSGDRKE